MRWCCPNCGKRVEFSIEQLAETHGVVVCPQCLSSDKVPGYDNPGPKPSVKKQDTRDKKQETRNKKQEWLKATISVNEDGASATPPERTMTTPPAHKAKPTPPPHRSRVSFSERPATTDTTPAKSKKSSGKKKKSKKSSKGIFAPKSALGCLWRSVVYTLLFLIIYIIFGLLLQGL